MAPFWFCWFGCLWVSLLVFGLCFVVWFVVFCLLVFFWCWLNGDEPATQDWVLAGVLDGLRAVNCREECRELLASYRKAFNDLYAGHINEDGTVYWQQLL